MNLRTFILPLLVFLSGCASVPSGPRFFEVKNETDAAVAYVYRLHTPPYMRKPDIKVNNVVVGELPVDSYTVLKLKPGTYAIKTDWGLLDNLILSKSATLSVTAGKSYYVNFAGRVGVIGTTVTYGAHVLSGEITDISTDLASCSYVAPQVSSLEQEKSCPTPHCSGPRACGARPLNSIVECPLRCKATVRNGSRLCGNAIAAFCSDAAGAVADSGSRIDAECSR
ncbi:MAG: DUF2846 domain-containing protein [Burkholderiales bacterium]|nr:DUF2846 domain-containing protein [Burkholderiales bacterium]